MELLAHSKSPGKLLLSGEHSTVYGKNAVAVTVDLYTTTKVYTHPDQAVTLSLKNYDFEITWELSMLENIPSMLTPSATEPKMKDKATFVYSEAVLQTVTELLALAVKSGGKDATALTCDNASLAFLLLYMSIMDRSFYYNRKPMKVVVESNMPSGAGLGSSSSYIVSVACALFDALDMQIDKEVFNQWCYEVDKLFHGKPSGVDNTICNYGGALLFRQGKIVEHINHDELECLADMNVLLVNTGVSRNTKAMVERCQKKLLSLPNEGKDIIDEIGNISQSIWDSMKDQQFAHLANLFDKNQQLLNDIDVGHEKIDEIVKIAKSFGYSAKLTGAGGGGIVFVYIPNQGDLTELIGELKNRGFETYNVKIGVAGVQIIPKGSELAE